MFATSSQLKFWTFAGMAEINQLRSEANAKYVERFGFKTKESARDEYFLSVEEESKIRRHYEYAMKDFCTTFQPSMPNYVVGTAMAFFKRFYLHNSVMDFHPKDIIHTCVYLACKVEEFNVSITQFVVNLKYDRDRAIDAILSQELLVMHEIHYHLTVHNPYRPIEGMLIDIKTRFPEIADPERLRRGVDEFLDRSLHTDVCLMYAPSQLALTALVSSASNLGVGLDSYIANRLLGLSEREALLKTFDCIKKIRAAVKSVEPLNRDEVQFLESKLSQCRNQENNPESELYKRKMEEELLEDEQDETSEKRLRLSEGDEEPMKGIV